MLWARVAHPQCGAGDAGVACHMLHTLWHVSAHVLTSEVAQAGSNHCCPLLHNSSSTLPVQPSRLHPVTAIKLGMYEATNRKRAFRHQPNQSQRRLTCLLAFGHWGPEQPKDALRGDS